MSSGVALNADAIRTRKEELLKELRQLEAAEAALRVADGGQRKLGSGEEIAAMANGIHAPGKGPVSHDMAEAWTCGARGERDGEEEGAGDRGRQGTSGAGEGVEEREGLPAILPSSEETGPREEAGTGEVAQRGDGGRGVSVGQRVLSAAEVQRYSRQMLLPAFGIQAQQRLKRSSVLIVGAGGLGSPVALYLAAAGIGRLGIVDRDVVEMSNLHRQIVHSEARVGQHKAHSAAEACRGLNSCVEVELHTEGLTPSNALHIASRYDIIVDASDNVTSRYLINDTAVVCGKPLVFGAALGVEGQITVYHHNGGPCYRCLFPRPPPAAACQRCSEAGVLGAVPGVIGVLQAVEAIKVAAGVGSPLAARMLHFDALAARFMQVKLRGRSSTCQVCGDAPEISRSSLPTYPYEDFTGSPFHDQGPAPLRLLPESSLIDPLSLSAALSSPHRRRGLVILDVRPRHLYHLASLPGALSIPLSDLEVRMPVVWAAMSALSREIQTQKTRGGAMEVVTVCRKGNDSQRAVLILQKHGIARAKSLTGGMQNWALTVDPDMAFL